MAGERQVRTFKVELQIPLEGVGDTMARISTEVIADDGGDSAREAGEQARADIDAFIRGYTADG